MKPRHIFILMALIILISSCTAAEGELPPSTPSPASPSATPATVARSTAAASETTEQGAEENQTCPSGQSALAIIVDPDILDSIRDGLTRFTADLGEQGFQVHETSMDFPTALELRAHLADLYQSTGQCLEGAYLIGDLPYAYQWYRMEYANPDIPPKEQEVISFQFYSDLDGVFAASEDYISPGGHTVSFDLHEGELDWEIWVGVLPPFKGDDQLTSQAINLYFEKNHAFRQGQYDIPHGYLEISEFNTAATQEEHDQIIELVTVGRYAWTPFSTGPNAQFFFNSAAAGMTVEQGYSALSDGVADYALLRGHGNWSRAGRIDINWVESNPVQTVFFSTSGCSVGNLDHEENFLTSVLYSPTSTVLLAWGTTSDSGGMGTNLDGSYGHNIASDLSEGKSFGQAVLEHVNTPLIHPWAEDRENYFSLQIFLGDPSLTLYP